MKALVILIFFASSSVFAGTPCLNFDGQKYCLAWVHKDPRMILNEYVLPGETGNHWTKMITVRGYQKVMSIAEVVNPYMQHRKTMLVRDAQVFINEKSIHLVDIEIVMWVLDPDKSHYEYVISRFTTDQDKPARAVIHSMWVPFSKKADVTQEIKQQNTWMSELAKLEPKIFETE